MPRQDGTEYAPPNGWLRHAKSAHCFASRNSFINLDVWDSDVCLPTAHNEAYSAPSPPRCTLYHSACYHEASARGGAHVAAPAVVLGRNFLIKDDRVHTGASVLSLPYVTG